MCTKAMLAHGVINPFRLVYGYSNGYVAQSTASTQAIGAIGKDAVADGEMASVTLEGIVYLDVGGTITAWDKLTSDANGKVVKSTRTADYIIGYAMRSAVSGDRIDIYLLPKLGNDTSVVTMTASGSVTANRFVDYAGASLAAATSKARGVALTSAANGETFLCQVSGDVSVMASTTVNVGAAVVPTTGGKTVTASAVAVTINSGATGVTSSAANGAITAITGGVLPQYINGYAVTAGSTDTLHTIHLV